MDDMPSEFQQFGKILILAGIAIIILGIVLLFIGKIPFIGKLPGDILIKGKNYTFYLPLATSIILSLLISLIIYLLRK